MTGAYIADISTGCGNRCGVKISEGEGGHFDRNVREDIWGENAATKKMRVKLKGWGTVGEMFEKCWGNVLETSMGKC